MKKYSLGLTATAVLTLGILTFIACEKEEKNTQRTSKNSEKIIAAQWGLDSNVCQTLLNASYTLAEEVDGEIQLTFDTDQFVSDLENNLNTYSDTQYVVEDVSVFFSDDFDAPVLRISVYDVTHERGNNAFFFLSVVNDIFAPGIIRWELPEGPKTTVECTSTGACCHLCSEEQLCCWPTPTGCTACCFANGCEQKVTTVYGLLMVCKTFSEQENNQ